MSRVRPPYVPPAKGPFSIQARANSFVYAFRGVRALLWREHNAWLHLLAAAGAGGAGWWFHISGVEWCLVAFAIASVLAAEAFNTAVETLADAVHPDENPLVGHAKDLAAAGVLLVSGGAAAVGLLIFAPPVGPDDYGLAVDKRPLRQPGQCLQAGLPFRPVGCGRFSR